MEERKTAGQQIWEHHNKFIQQQDDVREYSREQAKEIIRQVALTTKEATAFDIYKNKDFYVVCLQSEERMLMKTPLYKYFARLSCPTPIFQQSVWKYHHQSKDLEYLWTICDKLTYYDMINKPHKYKYDKEWGNQLKFVQMMHSGSLEAWVKKENREDVLKTGVLTMVSREISTDLNMKLN